MMRRHEHVTRVRIGGDEASQRLPFEVAGEEQPSAGRLHGEHEARLVVCRHRITDCIFERHVMHVWIATAGGRVQHADAAERIKRE
jgi:hypothetical protein